MAWVETWGHQRNRLFIEPEPDGRGTILVLKDGLGFADLENPRQFSPAEVTAIRQEGCPLHLRHSRMCGRPYFRGEPISVGKAISRMPPTVTATL